MGWEMMLKIQNVFFLFLGFSIIILIGCQSSPKKEVKYFEIPLTKEEVKYPEPEIFLSPGDELEIRFFYTPELNTIQTIRPDGKISLQLIGEVMAQGKTPAALKDELTKSFSKVIKQIDVTVIVQKFGDRRVYVGGAVRTPGAFPLIDHLSVLEAVMLAGGVDTVHGNYNNLIVIRFRDGAWSAGKVDLTTLLHGGTTEPIYLRPQDIVFVPETRVVKVNRWLDQHLGSILPEFNLGVTYNPTTGWTYGIQTGYDFSGSN
jgi:protein involved in polysaccharide export with SLBB domain